MVKPNYSNQIHNGEVANIYLNRLRYRIVNMKKVTFINNVDYLLRKYYKLNNKSMSKKLYLHSNFF